jgi:phosphomannomutase/phosphoglucomutase
MSDESTSRLRLPTAQLRGALPLVAGLCVLLAAWLAWTGWQQWQDASRNQALQSSRDLAVSGTHRALQQQEQRLRDALASPGVQAALSAGDLVTAAARIQSGWPHIEQAAVLPPDLDAEYAGLPQAGFGKLAVAEAALVADAPVARIAKDGGARLVLAAPARVGSGAASRLVGVAFPVLEDGQPLAVVYARLPLAPGVEGL